MISQHGVTPPTIDLSVGYELINRSPIYSLFGNCCHEFAWDLANCITRPEARYHNFPYGPFTFFRVVQIGEHVITGLLGSSHSS
jgi:hypothetical protein